MSLLLQACLLFRQFTIMYAFLLALKSQEDGIPELL
jgi:hypothetical protein